LVHGAKTTGPIAKKVVFFVYYKRPFPNYGACQKWPILFFSCPTTDVPSFVENIQK
jgi:hypothetical protein